MTTLAMITADIQDLSQLTSPGSATISSTFARTGTYSFRTSSGTSFYITAPLATTYYLKVALYYTTNVPSIRLDYIAGTGQLLFTFNTGSITITPTGLSATILPVPAIIPNVWLVVEIKAVCHATTGSVTIKINGITVVDVSNLNTAPESALGYSTVQFISGAGSYNYWDDIVIDDANWPGLGGLLVRVPTGNGNYTAWAGAFGDVGENPPNDADYVSTDPAVSGTKESFTKNVLPVTTSIVRRIGVISRGRINGAGGGILAPFIRSNSIDNVPTGKALDVSFELVARFWNTDPGNGGAAWSRTTVDAVEIGVASG